MKRTFYQILIESKDLWDDVINAYKKDQQEKQVSADLFWKNVSQAVIEEVGQDSGTSHRLNYKIADVVKDPKEVITAWLEDIISETQYYERGNYTLEKEERPATNAKRNAEYFLKDGILKNTEKRLQSLGQAIISIYANGDPWKDSDLREKLASYYDTDHGLKKKKK